MRSRSEPAHLSWPAADPHHQFDQQPVPHGVPVGVVEQLEVVDIKHEQRQGLAIAVGPSDLQARGLLEVAPVPAPGQAVRGGEAIQFQVEIAQLRGALRHPMRQGGIEFPQPGLGGLQGGVMERG